MWRKANKRKVISNISISLICMILICGMISCCSTITYAAPRTGDIELDYEGRTDYDDDVILEGAKFVIYPIKYVENGELVWRDELAKCGISLEDTSSEARADQAKKLYEYAKQNDIPGIIYVTDKKGEIEIRDLAEGIYLLAQTEEVEEGRDEFMSDPFLVMIPSEVDGEIEWDVSVEPKADWVSHDGEPVYPGDEDKPKEDPKDDPKDDKKDNPSEDKPKDNPKENTEKTPEKELQKTTVQEKIFRFGRTKTGDLSKIDIWFTIFMVSAGMITIVIILKKRK